MVRKLFKHEFLAYARVMSLVYIILLTMATVGRVIQFFENDSIVYTIVSVIANITYSVSIFAAIAFCSVFTIVRFYKNLFTSEGYLSFTLPVTPSQHILVKSVTALSFDILTWIVILISGCIITAGEMLTEIFKALGYIFRKLYELASFQSILIGVEVLLLLLVLSVSGILLYYLFIAIGQLFKKNRILAAVGASFVYYILTQICSTIVLIVFSVFVSPEALEAFGQFVLSHPYTSIHVGMCSLIVLSGIFSVIYFLVTKVIITKKLNLE